MKVKTGLEPIKLLFHFKLSFTLFLIRTCKVKLEPFKRHTQI